MYKEIVLSVIKTSLPLMIVLIVLQYIFRKQSTCILKTIYMHINRIQCRLFNCSYDAFSEFYAYSRYKRDYNTYNMFSFFEYEYIADVSYS